MLNAYTFVLCAPDGMPHPGMGVNNTADAADAAGHWSLVRAATVADGLAEHHSSDALLGGEDGVLTEGGYRARCWMEELFKRIRSKGEYTLRAMTLGRRSSQIRTRWCIVALIRSTTAAHGELRRMLC